MGQSVETEAPTVAEAVERALDVLGATEEEVDVRVLSEADPARVRVTRRGYQGDGEEVAERGPRGKPERHAHEQVVLSTEQIQAQAEATREFLDGLLDHMDFAADVEVNVSTDGVVAELVGDEMGLLIGRYGATLLAIQDLTRLAVKTKTGDWPQVRVDIEGYGERRREQLEQRALELAERVKETGTAEDMPPMPPSERRIVHEVLSSVEGVVTESEGEGADRHLVIFPA